MTHALLLRGLRSIDHHVFGARRCVQCGCTDRYACPGGCAWSLDTWFYAGADVCTACACVAVAVDADVAQPDELLEHVQFTEGGTMASWSSKPRRPGDTFEQDGWQHHPPTPTPGARRRSYTWALLLALALLLTLIAIAVSTHR